MAARRASGFGTDAGDTRVICLRKTTAAVSAALLVVLERNPNLTLARKARLATSGTSTISMSCAVSACGIAQERMCSLAYAW